MVKGRGEDTVVVGTNSFTNKTQVSSLKISVKMHIMDG
jgi:hypothetical protein